MVWVRLLFKLTTASSFAAAVVIALAGSLASARDDATAICTAAAEGYDAAIASGDDAKVAALFTTDGTWNTPSGIFQGRDAITLRVNWAVQAHAKDRDTVKIARHVGDTIVCSGAYTLTSPGPPHARYTGNWTNVLTKIGNIWMIADMSIN